MQLNDWQRLFAGFDLDNSGSLSSSELQQAIQQIGYRFSAQTLNTLMRTYDTNGDGNFALDEFIQIFCELHIITNEFKKYDTMGQGVAQMTYEQFIAGAFSIKR